MEAVLWRLMEGRPQASRNQKRNEQVLEENDDEDFVDEKPFAGLQEQIRYAQIMSLIMSYSENSEVHCSIQV